MVARVFWVVTRVFWVVSIFLVVSMVLLGGFCGILGVASVS